MGDLPGGDMPRGVQWNKPFNKVKRPVSAREADLTVHLNDVLFADDTTIFTTVEHHQADEQNLRTVLSTWGEDLNVDKTERIPLGMPLQEASNLAQVPIDTLQAEAKFLGAWITNTASQEKDTTSRIQRARFIWNKLWAQMQRLNLPAHTKGRLFSSTVLSSLCYSAEARGFTAAEIRRMQVFGNNCKFGLLNVRRRDMHDQELTMVDLWRRAGIPSVAVEIGTRQLRWLGHTARMPDDRLEKQALWLWLYTAEESHRGRRMTSKGTIDAQRALWARRQDLRKALGIAEAGWSTNWITRATADHGSQWRKDISTWKQTREFKEDADRWHARHAPGGPAERKAAPRSERRVELAGLTRTDDGKVLCPHCSEPFPVNAVWQHVTTCAVLPPHRRELAKAARARRKQRQQATLQPFGEQIQGAPPPIPPAAAAQAPALPRRRLHRKQPAPQFHPPAPPPLPDPAPQAVLRRPAANNPDAAPAAPRTQRRIGVSDLPA